MKRSLVVLTAAWVLMSSQAEAGAWSVGAGYGWASGDTGTGDINSDLRSSGLNAQAKSSDDTRDMWQVFMGYEFTPRWGVEGAYVDLGDVDTTFSGTAVDIDAFLSSSTDIHPNTAQGWQLSGVFRHELGFLPQFRGVGRLGVIAWESDYTLSADGTSWNVSDDGVDLTLGLGLELGLDRISWMPQGFVTHLRWDRYNIDDEPIDTLMLGLSYRIE